MSQVEPKLANARTFLSRWPLLLPALAIFLLTLLIYAPTFGAPEHWDDFSHLQENPVIGAPGGLYHIWFDPFGGQQYYYPAVFTTFWFEHQLWGFTPWPYHVVNTLLHAANGILLMLVLRRLQVPLAFLIALIFTCHPIHVESVVNIAERKNLLSFFFFMLATLAYWRFAEPTTKRRWAFYVAAMAGFILAIQSKTVVTIFPFVMALAHLYYEKKLTWKRIWPLIPFVLVAIPQGLIVSYIEHNIVGTTGKDFEFRWDERVLIAGRALWFYVRKIFWPYPLMPIYPRWQIDPAAAWQYVYPLSFAALFVALVALRKRIGRAPWILAACYVIIVSTALGFISFYTMIMSFVSDHYVYLGSVPIIAAGVLAGRWLVRKQRVGARGPVIAAMAVVALLTVVSIRQGMLWCSAVGIWEYNYRFNPHNSFVAANYGGALAKIGELDRAAELIIPALSDTHQRYSRLYNMGIIRSQQKRYAEAAVYFKQATDDFPSYYAAWRELGAHLLMLRDFSGALGALNTAISIDPNEATPYARKAYCQWALGDRTGAMETAQMAVKMDPSDTLAQKVLDLVTTTPPPTSQYNRPPAAPAKPE